MVVHTFVRVQESEDRTFSCISVRAPLNILGIWVNLYLWGLWRSMIMWCFWDYVSVELTKTYCNLIFFFLKILLFECMRFLVNFKFQYIVWDLSAINCENVSFHNFSVWISNGKSLATGFKRTEKASNKTTP